MTELQNDQYTYPGDRYTRNGSQSGRGMGISVRDYFAGECIAGILAGYWGNPDMGGLSPANLADEAFQMADAMMAMRVK